MSSKRADCPYKKLADSLREKKGLPWAQAKLEAHNGDGDYVEYFRGKDFARYFRANPEKMNELVQPIRAGRGMEDQIRDLMHFFVNKGLVVKTERKYKRPKPGKPRLVKWPRTLETARDQSWDEMAFYAWRYDRPTSMWYYVGAVAVPVLVILACLFPLAPWWMRMAFIYFLMGLLTILLLIIFVRYLFFGILWVTLGHYFWLFPNLMSDEVGVVEAFIPVISYSTPQKDEPSQWKSRLAAGLCAVTAFYALYVITPDEDIALDKEFNKYHDLLMEYMDVSRGFLEGSSTGAAAPLYQQATAQRGGAGYDPTGGKARASQKMREEFEEEQRQRILKQEEEEAARLELETQGSEKPVQVDPEEIPEASEIPTRDEL